MATAGARFFLSMTLQLLLHTIFTALFPAIAHITHFCSRHLPLLHFLLTWCFFLLLNGQTS